MAANIRIFISHSSLDLEFARALTGLLRSSLLLSASEIRCTSIDGYRLPAGAETDNQLRSEIKSADVFIGIISADSMKSLYVIFELGARWGAKLPLIPLLAPGVDAKILGGPIAGLNALSGANKSQLHQLISDLATFLAIAPENAAAYVDQIDAVLAIEKTGTSAAVHMGEPSSGKKLHQIAENILMTISRMGDYSSDAMRVAALIGESGTRTNYYLDQLLELNYLHDRLMMGRPSTYGLTAAGRAYLIENDLVT